ncbi:MAG: DNA/RNA helicase [Gloeocapsa sp. DLM2.Bin57]|nr:MAG: DNA/RNA helicase [Gloeocapsa sp. DLM2.Bin57]
MSVKTRDKGRNFIETIAVNTSGKIYEQTVWEACKKAFSSRECIGYWRYPIFSNTGDRRKEPDILIADRELGLVVIEVKGLTIDQITSINGHQWVFNNFYQSQGSPYQQAEDQLYSLLGYCNREREIRNQVRARAIVALPLISETQWQQKGFDQLPSCPPIIFSDQLGEKTLFNRISESTPVQSGKNLDADQWRILSAVIGGTAILRKPSEEVINVSNSNGKVRSHIIQQLDSRLYELDLQQANIGVQIPPGVQRIRGIAGSGKTVMLCQKAAHMHLKYPDWDIALVFFTRSLYDHIQGLVDRWLKHFSNGDVSYDDYKVQQKLKILHAWGAKDQPGFYRTVSEEHTGYALKVKDTSYRNPSQGLADCCKRLIDKTIIKPMFDAVLIDEGQDLVVDPAELQYESKQVIYWLAYQSLRPCNLEKPAQRRLIWAYDEAQSLETLKIPTGPVLFGKDEQLKDLLRYPHKGGIKASEIMKRCYRTPGPIIVAAHAIGMGLKRPEGMLSGITRQEDWENIGYEVQGKFNQKNEITITRPLENSPNLIASLWDESVIQFHTYGSRQEELAALAQNIKHNLEHDELYPSQQILVIVLGDYRDAFGLENEVARYLINEGIDIFIPSATSLNELNPQYPNNDPNAFWFEGGVTISKIHRAKGNEADMVYVVGCDFIARNESSIKLRNQLFVALTRARGWVNLSGIGDYPLYEEINEVLNSGNTITFFYDPNYRNRRNLNDESDVE